MPGGVTHRNVEALIGRLATDPLLRRRFATDPDAVLRELQENGYELTHVELEALAAIETEALRSFAQSIDRRLRRADHASDGAVVSQDSSVANGRNTHEERKKGTYEQD
jgi:hypothetical protein